MRDEDEKAGRPPELIPDPQHEKPDPADLPADRARDDEVQGGRVWPSKWQGPTIS